MFNILFDHIQDTCLLHYNIIQRDSEESQLTYEVCLQLTGPGSVIQLTGPGYLLKVIKGVN